MKPSAVLFLAAALLAGCDNMQHQENVRAYDPSKFFGDGASARTPPAHTVARGDTGPDDPLGNGRIRGSWVAAFPVPLTHAMIERGGERYAIFCAQCHGGDGYGKGIVVRRGFPQPPSFHDANERAQPIGSVFDAVSRGRGVMYGFADRITASDRWAIVAYIRALQKSQDATLDDVPAGERAALLSP